jgi:hypothetical protein
MVLTREELIDSLREEVRILVHLAGKVDQGKHDYRPTPKQRSTLELLQYMAIMGPTQVAVIQEGAFHRAGLTAAWNPAEAAAKLMNFDQAVSAIEKQSEEYSRVFQGWTDADFRAEVDVFGTKRTRGWLLVNWVLSGFAAYRTQLFCYLKSSGREELDTMNLWAGAERPS